VIPPNVGGTVSTLVLAWLLVDVDSLGLEASS